MCAFVLQVVPSNLGISSATSGTFSVRLIRASTESKRILTRKLHRWKSGSLLNCGNSPLRSVRCSRSTFYYSGFQVWGTSFFMMIWNTSSSTERSVFQILSTTKQANLLTGSSLISSALTPSMLSILASTANTCWITFRHLRRADPLRLCTLHYSDVPRSTVSTFRQTYVRPSTSSQPYPRNIMACDTRFFWDASSFWQHFRFFL